MSKKLVKHGNSWAFIFEKPIMEMLNINKDTELDYKIMDDGIFIKSKHNESKTDVDKVVDRIIEKYGPVFEKLAKT